VGERFFWYWPTRVVTDQKTVVDLCNEYILIKAYALFLYVCCRMNTESSTCDTGGLHCFLVKYSTFSLYR